MYTWTGSYFLKFGSPPSSSGSVYSATSQPSSWAPRAIHAHDIKWPKRSAAEKRTISWNTSLRFLAIVPSINVSISFLNGVNISPMWAKRRNFKRLIVEFYCLVIIGGMVASTSKMKNPFRYDFEMSLNVLLFGEATKKLSRISMHHDMSFTQTSQMIYYAKSEPIMVKTMLNGVRITVIHVII